MVLLFLVYVKLIFSFEDSILSEKNNRMLQNSSTNAEGINITKYSCMYKSRGLF